MNNSSLFTTQDFCHYWVKELGGSPDPGYRPFLNFNLATLLCIMEQDPGQDVI